MKKMSTTKSHELFPFSKASENNIILCKKKIHVLVINISMAYLSNPPPGWPNYYFSTVQAEKNKIKKAWIRTDCFVNVHRDLIYGLWIIQYARIRLNSKINNFEIARSKINFSISRFLPCKRITISEPKISCSIWSSFKYAQLVHNLLEICSLQPHMNPS